MVAVVSKICKRMLYKYHNKQGHIGRLFSAFKNSLSMPRNVQFNWTICVVKEQLLPRLNVLYKDPNPEFAIQLENLGTAVGFDGKPDFIA